MAKKFGFLLGVGVGYVLGARAGRQRYDQIVSKARGAWRSPTVQAKTDQAQQLAKEKAGQAGHAVMEKAGQGVHAAKEKLTGGDDSPSHGGTSASGTAGTATGPAGTTPTPADVHGSGRGGTPAAQLPSTPSDRLPPHFDGTGGTNS